MPRIFLSYRQSDVQPTALRLAERLRERYGPEVFTHIGHVPLGSDYRQVIARAVEQSDLVLVLIGPRWMELLRGKANQSQDFVRAEIEIALSKGLLTVPLLIGEETAMPQEEELPPRIGSLAYLQGFRILPDRDFDGQVRRFMEGLDQALSLRASASGTGAEPVGAVTVVPPPQRLRRLECIPLELRWVEAGNFLMGSPDDEPGRWPDEGPRHQVLIPRGFWLGMVPVTQGQFSGMMGTNPSAFVHAGELAPVETVSWREAREFCARLRRAEPPPEGFEYRLPLEAEWEYACRAGTDTALYNGPIQIRGANHAPGLDRIAWYGGNSGVEYDGAVDSSTWFEKQYNHQRAGTHPVGKKAPNAWGFSDFLGNVWEWCWDGKRAYQTPVSGLPAGPMESDQRVIRGGSWEDGPGDCRCATRFTAGERYRFAYVGFRLALAPVSSSESGRDVAPRTEEA